MGEFDEISYSKASKNTTALAEMSNHQLNSVNGNNLLLQQLAMSKGGRIGTDGKAVVAIRFDDWQDAFRTNIYPLLLERGLPCSMALISRFNTAQPWGAGTTWDDIKTWNQNGVEIWSHGTDHNDYIPNGYAGLYEQIVTSKEEIEAQGLKVQGWALPGATPLTGVIPYNGELTTYDKYKSDVGQLLLETYALTEAYAGCIFRQLIRSEFHGMNHYTVSDYTTDLSVAKSYVDYVIKNKLGIEFMCHAGNLDKPECLSLANFTAFLDYIKEKWDAGEIEVLTPSGLCFADISSSYRWDICRDGKFTDLTVESAGAWGYTSNWTGKSFPQSGGYSGGAYLSISSEAPTSNFVVQEFGSEQGLLSASWVKGGQWVEGEQWLFDGWFRSNGAGNAIGRVYLSDPKNSSGYTIIKSKNSNGSEWTRFRFAFGLPTIINSLLIGLGRDSVNGVDWSDVSVKKI